MNVDLQMNAKNRNLLTISHPQTAHAIENVGSDSVKVVFLNPFQPLGCRSLADARAQRPDALESHIK